jgi:predicted adenine nucleotide alpha hydrolase (AANH) superfamily ATPase
MKTQKDVRAALLRAWPTIVDECRQVLGSEQHYQAMVYHCLRKAGRVPIQQLGMNVKMGIYSPKTAYFRRCADKRHEDYQGHCEPIPDVAFFSEKIEGDWRRRQSIQTLRHVLGAIEIKASERKGYHLRPAEIISDIEKLAAHCKERKYRYKRRFFAAVMVLDTAPEEAERMTPAHLKEIRRVAREKKVALFYTSTTYAVPSI